MKSAKLVWSLASCASAFLLAGLAAVSGADSPSCEYKGRGLPDPVWKDVGDRPTDDYFFTSYSDVDPPASGKLRLYVRGVHNKSSKFLLPFAWPEAGLSYKEVDPSQCVFNPFTTSADYKEVESRILYGTTLKEHADVPLYLSGIENDGKRSAPRGAGPTDPSGPSILVPPTPRAGGPGALNLGGQRVIERGDETPELVSMFVVSSSDRERSLDLRFTSDAVDNTINFGFGNRSRRAVQVAVPALGQSISAIEQRRQGKAEYRVEAVGEKAQGRVLVPAESHEDRNKITLRFEGFRPTAERLVTVVISDAAGKPIGTCKMSAYLPVDQD
jgi:hypothetical protein